MVEIRITYETLFDLLRREKNREELQKLDDDFYVQVISYLREKQEIINKKDERLFLSADKEKLKIQFQNIRRIIKELYEKREKKIVHMAVIKARTGSEVIDTSSLLPMEREFFEEQVLLIQKYKEKILDCVLTLKDIDFVDVKKNMADEAALIASQKQEREDDEEKSDNLSSGYEVSGQESSFSDLGTENHFSVQKENEKKADILVKKIKFKISLPQFIGRNGEVLGPFQEGEIADVDETIADILIRKGRAEAE